MKKKLLSMALVAMMVATMFSACGKKAPTGMTVNDGVLTMATNAYFPPYEYYEGDQVVGIDADIAQAIADKLGLELQIVTEDSDIATVDDLAGKKIGVQLATTGDIYSKDDFGEENVEEYNKGADAVMALTQGKVDAVIIDKEPAKNFVEANEGLKLLDTEYVTEDYAAALNKDNTELLDAVNGALAELKEDGTLQSIIDKYITAE